MFQGVTFKVEGGDLVIARILHGGIIDQQGLLHVGDVIKEVSWASGTRVGSVARWKSSFRTTDLSKQEARVRVNVTI